MRYNLDICSFMSFPIAKKPRQHHGRSTATTSHKIIFPWPDKEESPKLFPFASRSEYKRDVIEILLAPRHCLLLYPTATALHVGRYCLPPYSISSHLSCARGADGVSSHRQWLSIHRYSELEDCSPKCLHSQGLYLPLWLNIRHIRLERVMGCKYFRYFFQPYRRRERLQVGRHRANSWC